MKAHKILGIIALGVGLSTTQAQPSLPKQEFSLPELGDSSSSTISLAQEYKLGRAWLMSFRSQVKTISDPLLQDYVEDIIYHLATFSELKDRRLDIVVVDNPTINAFAVPGGVIGINSGLLIHAKTEAQLATVISHELAHLSQRHFSRSVEQQKRDSLPNMAGLLAGIILAATTRSDAGIAAITASQAASLQSQLRFSRLHEQEADRIGMQTMVRAEMDPNAVGTMFENMLKATRYAGNRPPEFLLTHPVTENRVSDAKNRARQYPRKVYTNSLAYQLMRTRVELSFTDNSSKAVQIFRNKLKNSSQHSESDQYGLILALTQNSEYSEARKHLNPLRQSNPSQVSYIVAESEIDLAENQYQAAIDLLSNSLSITPGNHPLTMTLAKALLKANKPQHAEVLLKEHVNKHPNNPNIWYLLAETHGLAGNIIGVHQARAEYFVLNGVLDKAQRQLGYALELVKGNDLSTIRIKERIKQIKQLKRSLKKL